MNPSEGPADPSGSTGPLVPVGPVERARWAAPFLAVGSVAVVGGGLVAAVTRPTHFTLGPWVAAFLVLVVGVAQIALGAGQAWLADQRPTEAVVRAELATWNLGAVATLGGSIGEVPLVTTVGGLVTVVALACFLRATWAGTGGPRWAQSTYVAGVAVLLVSTPIGVALAWAGP